MSNTLTLSEPNVNTLVPTWTGLELWHASTEGGSYSLLVQIPYVLNQTVYPYTDAAGVGTDWYKSRRYGPASTYSSFSPVWAVSVNTVTLFTLKSTFWGLLGELYQGTATGGSISSVIDVDLQNYVSEMWPAKLEGQQLRITGGSAVGDLRVVGKVDRSDGTIYPNRDFSATVANGDSYELWGTAIMANRPLNNLFNTVIRNLKPVTDTQIEIVNNQRMYDVSTVVLSKRDIHQVYLRLVDASGIEPYRIRDLAPGMDWNAYDRLGSTMTQGVTLELASPLVHNLSANELWLRGETSFIPFVDDSSTVEADYRDWLAWEAVLELARRKLSLGTADRARWQGLQERAIEELTSHRTRWLAGHEPVRIATWA